MPTVDPIIHDALLGKVEPTPYGRLGYDFKADDSLKLILHGVSGETGIIRPHTHVSQVRTITGQSSSAYGRNAPHGTRTLSLTYQFKYESPSIWLWAFKIAKT